MGFVGLAVMYTTVLCNGELVRLDCLRSLGVPWIIFQKHMYAPWGISSAAATRVRRQTRQTKEALSLRTRHPDGNIGERDCRDWYEGALCEICSGVTSHPRQIVRRRLR